jgi:hypothetical protein
VSSPDRSSDDQAGGAVLAEVARTADPALHPHAERDPPSGSFEGRFPPGADRAFVVEAIHEGWLMHCDAPRLFKGTDDDLRLLGGDALFALGLARLAEAGDLAGVAELADLISLAARAVAEDRPEWASELWRASVDALAQGGGGSASGGARAAFERLAADPGAGERG